MDKLIYVYILQNCPELRLGQHGKLELSDYLAPGL